METRTVKRGIVVKLVINLFLLALAAWIILNRQFLLDYINLFNYNPPAEIQALAHNTSMNDLGKRSFYVSHPILADRTTFNNHCINHGKEQTIILGCYNGVNIFIYNITDQRLPGVKEVTAAHEMLHSAWDRLENSEKDSLIELIEKQFKITKDERILGLINIYRQTEPNELHNEMHSIFGTELKELSPELENYYKKYFINRNAVVEFSQKYEGVFTDLKSKQTTLVKEIEALANEIKTRTTAFNKAIVDLDRDIKAFNAKAEVGEFTSQSEFNQQRNALVNRQQELESKREFIEQLRAAFERKQKELEAINLEVNSLNQSLDSTPAEVPSL